jgi:hypothetical protein
MCDTEFGNINIPNTNYQNKDEIERNFPKIRNIIDSLDIFYKFINDFLYWLKNY